MRQVRLGQTDLRVSAIAFGTWAFGGDWGPADRKDSTDAIHRAPELGINLFDTAQGYGFGASERLLGQALWARVRREDVVIETKGGLRLDGDRLLRDASRRWLREGVHSPACAAWDIEQEILPYAAAHDIGMLVYGPLAHGLLSGRMTPSTSFDADDWRAKSPDFTSETFRRNLAVVERLKQVARKRDVSLPQLAVAWTLANPAVHVAIVGARRPSQLEGTAPAADIELSAEELAEIDAIVADAVPVWGPHPEGM